MRNITYIITLLDKNGKSAIYTGENIHELYCYLEIIGAPNTLTTICYSSHNFGTSYLTNNDTETIQTFIADTYVPHKTISEFCERIEHNYDALIIRGPKLLPPSPRRKMNQFNNLNGDEQNEPLREWNRKIPAVHFKSLTSPSKTNPVVLAIMGRLYHHAIDNGDVEVYPSDYLFESTSESVTDTYTTMTKSIDDDEMDQLT